MIQESNLQEGIDALALRNMQLQHELNTLKKSQNASSSSSSSSSTSSNRRTSVSGVASLSATTFLETTGACEEEVARSFVCGEENEGDGIDLTSRISMRKELAGMIRKYENLQIHHQSLKKKHDTTVDRLGKFKGTYNDLRRHCYLIEEDKKSLYEHSKWQEGHIDLLQRDMQELHTCNIKNQILIEQLQKENTILQVTVAEKTMIGDVSLQAKYEALQQKMNVLKRQKDEAYGVVLELRSNLKQLEKNYDKLKEENIGLKEVSARNLVEIQREQTAIQHELKSRLQHQEQPSTPSISVNHGGDKGYDKDFDTSIRGVDVGRNRHEG